MEKTAAQRTSTYIYGAEPYVSPKHGVYKPNQYAQEVFNEAEKAKTFVDACDEPEDREKPIEPVVIPENKIETTDILETSEDEVKISNSEDETPILGAISAEDSFTDSDTADQNEVVKPAVEPVIAKKTTARKAASKKAKASVSKD